MEIKNYISELYPTVHPFEGINSIEEKLLEKGYLVVTDGDVFKGILTPCDLVKRPHKIVIDCLTKKGHVSNDETIMSVLDKFNKNECSALPVFQDNRFIGVIDKYILTNKLEFKINELHDRSIISQKAKTAFLHNLSHEVRTPLNVLLGFIEIISKLDMENYKTEGKKYCSTIRNCAERFLLVMNDLIDLSLIDSGENLKVEKESVRVEDIFSELKEHFETVTSQSNKTVTIHYSNPDSSFVIFSDKKKIKHILYHLIDNAIKFSTDTKVTFGYKIEDQNIVFFVTNKGTQIDEDRKKKMFEVFEKQDFYNDECVSGLGIGLPLVKKLTELLEGKVDFVTNEIHTAFYCAIPT